MSARLPIPVARLLAPLFVTLVAYLVGLCGCSVTQDGDQRELHAQSVRQRQIRFDGADNFRDLGGYRTADGHETRWRTIFRSDDLSQLTSDDVDQLSGLGVRWVCDLRSESERDDAPDRLPTLNPPRVDAISVQLENVQPVEMKRKILAGDLDDVDFSEMMIESNRAFVSEYSEQFSALLVKLSFQENLPAIVHCTGGKDRAGFASAIVLRALGVPRDTVMADYLLTNELTMPKRERQLWLIWFASLFRVERASVRPLMRAEAEYLGAAFDEIDTRFGSFENYLSEELMIDDATLARLRYFLLTDQSESVSR